MAPWSWPASSLIQKQIRSCSLDPETETDLAAASVQARVSVPAGDHAFREEALLPVDRRAPAIRGPLPAGLPVAVPAGAATTAREEPVPCSMGSSWEVAPAPELALLFLFRGLWHVRRRTGQT